MVSNDEILNLQKPDLIKLILVKVDPHPHYINLIVLLDVATYLVARLETEVKRSLFGKPLIVLLKLSNVILCLPVE